MSWSADYPEVGADGVAAEEFDYVGAVALLHDVYLLRHLDCQTERLVRHTGGRADKADT